jgi:predicted DNA-binding transcriptional regulator AlpA
MNFSTDERGLDTRKAAEFLGISRSLLSKLRLIGNGPRYIKIGRLCIYLQKDLSAWRERYARHNTSGR